jgi:hypothetical protein
MVKSLLVLLALFPVTILSTQKFDRETLEWNCSIIKDLDSAQDVSNSCRQLTTISKIGEARVTELIVNFQRYNLYSILHF